MSTLYLLSQDTVYRRRLTAAINGEPSLRLVAAFDAMESLAAAQLEAPARLVIMDIQREHLPWLSMIGAMAEKGAIILLTGSAVSDRFLSQAVREGISGFVSHQQGTEKLIERCLVLGGTEGVPYRESITPEERVGRLLVRLGMKSHLTGYHYLCHMIAGVMADEERLMHVGDLYADASRHFDCRPVLIERNVRNAITLLWHALDMELGILVFGKTRCYQDDKPSNSAFMGMIANYLRKVG